MTKTHGFARFNLASKWKRKYLGWTPEEGGFILTNLDSFQSAILIRKFNAFALNRCPEP